jgi:hypothetical protein
MVAQAHPVTRNLVTKNHRYQLIVEVSRPTGAIFEGTVFENGVKVKTISSTAGDTEGHDEANPPR